MLAEAYTDMEAARLLVMQAAYIKEQGKPFGTAAAMAKLFASEIQRVIIARDLLRNIL